MLFQVHARKYVLYLFRFPIKCVRVRALFSIKYKISINYSQNFLYKFVIPSYIFVYICISSLMMN